MKTNLIIKICFLFYLYLPLSIYCINSYETISTKGNYVESAFNSGNNQAIIAFYDSTNSILTIKEYSRTDGTCQNTYTFSYTSQVNSKMIFLSSISCYILANKKSYFFDSTNLGSTISPLTMSNSVLHSNVKKATSGFLENGTFFVGGTTSNVAFIEVFKSDYTSLYQTTFSSINGDFLSCIGIKTNNKILCFYKNTYSQEGAYLISPDLSSKKSISIDPSADKASYGELLVYSNYNSDQILYCVLKSGGYLYCNIGEYSSSDNNFYNVSPKSKSNNYAAVFFCQMDITYVNVAIFSSNQYVGICINSQNSQQFIFSQVKYVINGAMSFQKQNVAFTIGSNLSYFQFLIINSAYIGVFFNAGSNLYYSILYYPHCENISITDYIDLNGEKHLLNFTPYITKGLGETSTPTQIKFTSFDSTGNIAFYSSSSSSTPVSLSTSYTASSLYYTTGTTEGEFTLKFMPVNSSGEGAKICLLTLKIEGCFVGCGSCSEYGTTTNMKCLTCDNGSGYYKKIDETVGNCYALPQNKYYLSGSILKKCFVSCLTCSRSGSDTNNNCDTCDNANDYFKVNNKPYQCWNNYTKEDNYFLTSINAERKYITCYLSCSSCLDEGNHDDNKCTKCDNQNGYYSISDNPSNCVNTPPPNYYLDTITSSYYKCYHLCNGCVGGYSSTEHNCTDCSSPTSIKQPLKESNCVIPCSAGTYWYLDENFVYQCTSGLHCPESRPIFEPNQNQCIESCKHTGTCVYCRDNILYEYNNECIASCPYGTKESLADRYCVDDDVCKYETYSSNITLTDLSNNINNIGLNYSIQYSHTEKQVVLINSENNDYKTIIFELEECAMSACVSEDLTKLNLANCPQRLREKYGIPETEPFIIIKTDIYRSQENTNQIAYAFFNKQGTRLNLDYCSKETFEIKYPISDPEAVELELAYNMSLIGVDIYNSSDPFFNDICFPFTSEEGKDVSLEDRRANYYKNVSFCEDECEYNGIDYLTKEAICECNVKPNFLTEALNNSLTSDYLEIIQSAKVEIFKCYKNVFNLKNLKINLGSWIMIAFSILEFIFFCVYLVNGVIPIKVYLLQFMNNPVNPPKTKGDKRIMSEISDNHKENHYIYYQPPKKFVIEDLEDGKPKQRKIRREDFYSLSKKKEDNDFPKANIIIERKPKIPETLYKEQNNKKAPTPESELKVPRTFYKEKSYEKPITPIQILHTEKNATSKYPITQIEQYEEGSPDCLLNPIIRIPNNVQKLKLNNPFIHLGKKLVTKNHENLILSNGKGNDVFFFDSNEVTNKIITNREPQTKRTSSLNSTPREEIFNVNTKLKDDIYSDKNLVTHHYNVDDITEQNNEKTEPSEIFKDISDEKKLKFKKKNLKKIDDTFNSEQNGSLTNDQIINKTKIILNNIELGQGGIIKPINKEENEEEEDFGDDELNELCVEDARKYDNRKFCEFYWFLLKTKQDIINTFFNSDPLDCFPVRCICFIFGIAVYFFVNALFFIESYISSSLHGEEQYGIFSIIQNETSRLIYSSIVAIVVDMFENCLSNSKKRLETLIRKMKMKKQFEEESYQILQNLKMRHKIFFVAVLLLMGVFWYYTSAFCNVYYNSRINWLEGSIFTFLITNVFFVIYCFIVAVLRYLGLRYKWLTLLYKLSQFLT